MYALNRVSPFLGTNDLQRTIDFYTQQLGFRIETLDPPDAPTLCILDRDQCSLIFDSTLWPQAPQMTGQLHFDVQNVQALYEALRHSVEILWGPEVYPYGRREFSCRDPNGYALVFSEPTSDQPTCRS